MAFYAAMTILIYGLSPAGYLYKDRIICTELKRAVRIVGWSVGIFLLIWGILTLWAEGERPSASWNFGSEPAAGTALIRYNPDLFYNLDHQVSRAFAEGLAEEGWQVDVVTTAGTEGLDPMGYDLYVFCANTYNWAPDRQVSKLIRSASYLRGKPAAAITLGSGSTGRSQRLLEELLLEKGAKLIRSETYWLMKPNDESRPGVPNTQVAREAAFRMGHECALLLRSNP